MTQRKPFNTNLLMKNMQKNLVMKNALASWLAFLPYLLFLFLVWDCSALHHLLQSRRTKEIGVRKVLGASVFNLWKLLRKDFVILVVISLFIAVPVAYYFMHNWLQNYQYRINYRGGFLLQPVLVH